MRAKVTKTTPVMVRRQCCCGVLVEPSSSCQENLPRDTRSQELCVIVHCLEGGRKREKRSYAMVIFLTTNKMECSLKVRATKIDQPKLTDRVFIIIYAEVK
jgi:hypothetical protein